MAEASFTLPSTPVVVRTLKELAKTAEEGYTGVAAYECSDRDTERAEFLVRVCNETIARLET